MGDATAASAAPPVLIQTFAAPRLGIEDARDPEKKREFLLSYRSYVAKCIAADATGINVQTVTLLSCLDEAVVQLILAIGDIRDSVGATVLDKEAITAPLLETWLDPVVVTTDQVTKSELKMKLQGIKWKFGIKFGQAVSMLAGDIYLELVKSGYKDLLNDETTTKWLTQTFRDKIAFHKFKEDLSTKLARDEDIEKSWIQTIRTAQDLAIGYDVHVENKSIEKSSSSTKPKDPPKDAKADGKQAKKRKPAEAKGKKDSAPLCLNQEECPGERHYLKDCTKTSEDLKKTLLNEYKLKKEREKAQRESKKKQRINAVLKNNLARDTTKFFIQAQLVDAEADSGSAVTVCPSRLIQQLRSRGIALSVKSIPLRSYRIADNTQSVSVKQEVNVPKLTMLSAGNTVELANVRMFLSDDVPLVLLGRALLNEMGFSFTDFLKRRGTALDGRDMQHVSPEEDDEGSESGVYAASPVWAEEEEDGLEPNESSLPSKEELDARNQEFEAMISRAKKGPHGEELEKLVRKYRDVFTSGYTAEPAKVEPMKVDLKDEDRKSVV